MLAMADLPSADRERFNFRKPIANIRPIIAARSRPRPPRVVAVAALCRGLAGTLSSHPHQKVVDAAERSAKTRRPCPRAAPEHVPRSEVPLHRPLVLQLASATGLSGREGQNPRPPRRPKLLASAKNPQDCRRPQDRADSRLTHSSRP